MHEITAAMIPGAPPDAIVDFRGEYRFLSNFHPCEVLFEGETYPSSEHAFMAAKTLDPALRRHIARLPTAKEAKAAGRALVLRPDWDAKVRRAVMRAVVGDKFRRNVNLREMLLATGERTLIEGTFWHDQTWGVCVCPQHGGKGSNWLGEILMDERTAYSLA